MDKKALKIVEEYIFSHLDKSDKIKSLEDIPGFEVFIVWKCKTLQNWKYLISSNLLDLRYYELTYDGDQNRWYVDIYTKIDQRIITE